MEKTRGAAGDAGEEGGKGDRGRRGNEYAATVHVVRVAAGVPLLGDLHVEVRIRVAIC